MYPVAFKSAAPIHVAIRIMKVGSDSETVADCLRSISVWFFFAPSRLRVRPEDAVIDRKGDFRKFRGSAGRLLPTAILAGYQKRLMAMSIARTKKMKRPTCAALA